MRALGKILNENSIGNKLGRMNTASQRRFLAFLTLFLSSFSQARVCLAFDSTSEAVSPIAILGIASADRVSEHLREMAKGVGIETVLQSYLNSFPESLDRKRPFGIVTLNGLRDRPNIENDLNRDLDSVILIPVKNASAFLSQLHEIGLVERLVQNGDVWEFQAPIVGRLFAIERDGWMLVVADDGVLFERIPINLDKVLHPLNEGYDLFAAINPKNLPPAIRDRFRDEIMQSHDQLSFLNLPEEQQSESQSTLRKRLADGLFDAFDSIDQWNLSVTLLGPDASSIIESNVLLEPASQVSEELGHLSEVPSLFSKIGFAQEVVRSGIKLRLPKSIADFFAAEFTKSMLDEQRKDLEGDNLNSKNRFGMTQEAEAVIFKEVTAIVSDTLRAGDIDFLTVVGKSPSQSASMFRVFEPKRFEIALRELQKTLGNRTELGKIDMHVEKYRGVEIHTATLSNLNSDGNRIIQSGFQPLADEMTIAIGISKEVFLYATGESPVADLKTLLDIKRNPSRGKSRDDMLVHLEVSVSFLLSQLISLEKPDSSDAVASKANFEDKLNLELKTVPNGLSGRIYLKHALTRWIVNEFPTIVERFQAAELERQGNPFSRLQETEENSMRSPHTSSQTPRSQNSGSSRASLPKKSSTKRSDNSKGVLEPMETAHKEIARFEDLLWGVKGLDFSPDGRTLAAGKPDQKVVMLDIAKKSTVSVQDNLAKLGSAQKCMFSPDGKKLVVGGQSGELAVFSISKNSQLKQISTYSFHSGEIQCLAISEDGKMALSGDQAKKVFCWDVLSGNIIANIGGFDGPIKAVRFASQERTAYATDGSRLVEFDLDKKKVVTERKLAESWASGQAAAFSPDGKYLAVGDTYDIRLWNLRNGVELPKLISQEIQWSMQFTPDSEHLLSGSSGKVSLWDIKTTKLTSVQKVIDFVYVQSLAISRDGKRFAVPSNQDVRVFELNGYKRQER
jgi:WD40 repeat protein